MASSTGLPAEAPYAFVLRNWEQIRLADTSATFTALHLSISKQPYNSQRRPPWILTAETFMFFGWSWTPQLPPGSFHPDEEQAILSSSTSKLARTPYFINIYRYKTSPVGQSNRLQSRRCRSLMRLCCELLRTLRWDHVHPWILQDCCSRWTWQDYLWSLTPHNEDLRLQWSFNLQWQKELEYPKSVSYILMVF